MGSVSLLEYASAQDFVEFDRISNVKMKSVVDFRTECKILKEPNLEMSISSDDNSTSTMRGKPWSDIDETSGIHYSNTNESTGAVGFQFRTTPKIHIFRPGPPRPSSAGRGLRDFHQIQTFCGRSLHVERYQYCRGRGVIRVRT
jgi:hypothetical protein